MKNVFFIGSFNPITNGHLEIIKRAYKIFDNINILILENKNKTNNFIKVEDRIKIIENIFINEKINGKVYYEDNLLVENIEKYNIDIIIRGIRDEKDFSYELLQNKINNSLKNEYTSKEIEFIYLFSKDETSFISSSMIRELYNFNGKIEKYVPEEVYLFLRGKNG